MAVDDKKIYVPLTTIYGTKQNDGSYNLSALDVKNINDNLWNIVNKLQGGITLSDITSLTVDELRSTTVITQNLYATYGDIAELTVDRLLTGNKVQRYLDSDTSDINYILAQEQYIKFITGSTTGATTQHTDRSGNLLYWTSATHTGMGTAVTDYPVVVYAYTELVKAQYAFDNTTGTYVPTIILGAGSGTANYGKAFIYKDTNGLYIDYYKSTDGTKYTISITDDGIDFGGFPLFTADGTPQLWVQAATPTGAKANDVWVDTDNYSRYDVTVLTDDTTLLEGDNEVITASGTITVTLHAETTAGIIKKIYNIGTGIVTVAGTINGVTNMYLYPSESVDLITDGSGWRY